MCTKSSFSICLTQIFFFFLFITALFGVASKTVLRWENCVLGLNVVLGCLVNFKNLWWSITI